VKQGTYAAMALAVLLYGAAPVQAQELPALSDGPTDSNYVVGARDVLLITSYDQSNMTGTYTVETDGTFTYPLLGRVHVGGLTLRDVEDLLKTELVSQGFFGNPQIAVAIEQYRSQNIYVVGEVRAPGAYPMSGGMRLMEALALAGSTLTDASGEVVIVHTPNRGRIVTPVVTPTSVTVRGAGDAADIVRVHLGNLELGGPFQNVRLQNGDTVFVLRAISVYVFGQARNPGAYPLRHPDTTVLQALALAGGVTDRGSTGRISVVRSIDGEKQEFEVELTDYVLPQDTIVVPERFFYV
jgi:polysaccharide export outer membrane protein